ncbi:hypothetical protein M2405_004001 [Rhodococcus erythropolis]|nr:hypothetical protein [Rhodococcus erythropolis]MCW2425211.1 hypothetical protein [Rhodococcus erythropolis]
MTGPTVEENCSRGDALRIEAELTASTSSQAMPLVVSPRKYIPPFPAKSITARAFDRAGTT